ncbi:MAG: ATP-binding protein [Planctomycetaceae bacterium]
MNYMLSRMSIRLQLIVMTIIFLLGLAVFGLMAHNTIQITKVDGPRYKHVIQMKDLLADVLPPPEYIIEAHLLVLQMAQFEATPEEIAVLAHSLTIVETAYLERHRFWVKTLPEGPLRDLTVVQSFKPAQQFFETVRREFLPLVLSGQSGNAQKLANGKLRQLYDAHRRCIDEIVMISKVAVVTEEASSRRHLEFRIFFIVLLGLAVAVTVGLISHIIGRRIVLRLAQVMGVLDAVAKGDLSQRLVPTGSDEISHITIAMNQAIAASSHNLDAVHDSEQIIRNLNADLESRVSARTHDLELAKIEAVYANQAKSQFLTTMSHELRTPLNGILGMNELLLKTELSERQVSYVDASRTSGKLLLQLINNVLDLSRIEAGKVELDLHECQIETLVCDVVDVMNYGAAQKGIHLRTHVSPSACVNAMCDSHRLRQILVNLIGNAIKFTSTGSVTVGVECLQHDQFNARIRMSVTDTGIGIPAEKLDSMFCPFTQAESSTTRNFGGTGLGLSICKELVELMGGRIGIDSAIGHGSTFWFEVPVQLSESTTDVDSLITVTAQKPIESTVADEPNFRQAEIPPQLSGHVLVVEDNRINQMFVEEILKHFGCTCDLAEDGEDAVAAVQGQQYDLVLMDCQMPVMDGFNATRAIRRWEAGSTDSRRIPNIALTANAVSGDRERCVEAGMDDYLTKPLNSNLLLTTLLQHLPSREAVCLQ